MPSVLPLGDPAPSDGLLPAQAADGAAGRRIRAVRPHPLLCRALRVLRLQHLHSHGTGRRGVPGRLCLHGYLRGGVCRQGTESQRAAGPPDEHSLFRRRHAHAAPRRGPRPHPHCGRSTNGDWSPAPKSPPKPTRIPLRRSPSGCWRMPDSPACPSGCSRQSRMSSRSWTAPTPPAGCRRWCNGHGTPDSPSAWTLSTARRGSPWTDWRYSLETALSYGPDHISAYALIVEDGTKLAAQIRRGEVPGIDDDDHADKYELADELISAAGLGWYEVSNWSRTPEQACRHNLAYWRGDDWWGIGPGAHSHVGGVRWWNVKHPTAYAGRLAGGALACSRQGNARRRNPEC